MFIISVGLLGLAGLQATGLKANQSAYMRSTVTQFANEIIDKMRANQSAALNNSYTTQIGNKPEQPPKNCLSVTCTPTEIALYDLYWWKKNLQERLPSADAVISRTGNLFTVTLQWDDSRGLEAAQQFVITTEL